MSEFNLPRSRSRIAQPQPNCVTPIDSSVTRVAEGVPGAGERTATPRANSPDCKVDSLLLTRVY